MNAIDSEELLYNIFRFAFAGGLLAFLAIMVRVMLREVDVATRDTIDATSATPSTAWLMVIDGGGSQAAVGQNLQVSRHVTIGRSPDCDLIFDDPSVSSVHASLFLSNGEWIIEDFGSMNGTYVDGAPVREETVVTDGDVLQFGRIRARLMC